MLRPPTIRPRTKPPQERREEIMNAALRLFLKQGVAPTKIEDITAGADVAKGTFYLYFSSKDDVLGALAGRFAEELLRKITAAVQALPTGDWKGRLAAWARAAVSAYLDSLRLHDIAFYGGRPRPREGLIDNIIIDHLSKLLRDGTGARAWSIEDPQGTAVFLFGGLHSAVEEAGRKRPVNARNLTRRVEGIFVRAVGSKPTTKKRTSPRRRSP
jgi:AcrR family transcriptional regulator